MKGPLILCALSIVQVSVSFVIHLPLKTPNKHQIYLHEKLADSVNEHVAVIGTSENKSRRFFLSHLAKAITTAPIIVTATSAVTPAPAFAGEVGAKINAAVTQSDLGISVRRSVVRGAQTIDKIDLKWEKFSDKYGLGTERSKQAARPKPKEIPERLPLDEKVARGLLDASDTAFLSITKMKESDLDRKIQKIDSTVRKSFERAGTTFDANEKQGLTSSEYNYFCYVHFRAFNELLIEENVNFNSFRKQFEKFMGDEFVKIVLSEKNLNASTATTKVTSPTSLKEKLESSIQILDTMNAQVRETGLVALADRSDIDAGKVDDWANDLSDLQFSISLDGDATQSAQILLQEQGYRLYPDLIRFGVMSILKDQFNRGIPGEASQSVTTDEYYMDTDYNSDPDKFSVKEVLLNIVVEST